MFKSANIRNSLVCDPTHLENLESDEYRDNLHEKFLDTIAEIDDLVRSARTPPPDEKDNTLLELERILNKKSPKKKKRTSSSTSRSSYRSNASRSQMNSKRSYSKLGLLSGGGRSKLGTRGTSKNQKRNGKKDALPVIKKEKAQIKNNGAPPESRQGGYDASGKVHYVFKWSTAVDMLRRRTNPSWTLAQKKVRVPARLRPDSSDIRDMTIALIMLKTDHVPETPTPSFWNENEDDVMSLYNGFGDWARSGMASRFSSTRGKSNLTLPDLHSIQGSRLSIRGGFMDKLSELGSEAGSRPNSGNSGIFPPIKMSKQLNNNSNGKKKQFKLPKIADSE